MMMMIMMMTKK